MPKIEVNENIFFDLVEERYDYERLEKELAFAKAELDELPDENETENRIIKIELNDTNRPDLWSTAGLARLLRVHRTGRMNTMSYDDFMSTKAKTREVDGRVVKVDKSLEKIRPFMTAFVISGKPINEEFLADIIQTQEKLCTGFGRKRKSFSMGVYRVKSVDWPIYYTTAKPTESFIPLGQSSPMTLKEILEKHPKGIEYADILKDFDSYPILKDSSGKVLSFPPIINSADIGAVQVGDSDLLVEFTGVNIEALLLATNIVACDFADAGYKILPVTNMHEYETSYGSTITSPYYFQTPTRTTLEAINKLLGTNLSLSEVQAALKKMDCKIDIAENTIIAHPSPYRNDFLHEVDIIEDVMMGLGVETFEPETPKDFTVGRLLPITKIGRKLKSVMVGLGFQEMIMNYLGSKKNFVENMLYKKNDIIEIANPMSESYNVLRHSVLPSLFIAESVSGTAIYPHKIFEFGKVARINPETAEGTETTDNLGFLLVSQDANYNEAASIVATLFYFLGLEYKVKESDLPLYIKGRQAEVSVNGLNIGHFGEVAPEILTNWQMQNPAVACEINIRKALL
ncbi:MAG: phenylalanine--tRNA ligase subunit beta [Treponemataceae bacterium]